MKEKLEKFLRRHTQTSIFLWMVVGGYLLYLAWQIFSSDMGDADPVLLTAAMVIFVIAGLALVAVGLYAMIKKCYKVRSFTEAVEEKPDDEADK